VLGHDLGDDLILGLESFLQFGHFLLHLTGGARTGGLGKGRRAGPLISSDVVGPICESGDFFCKDRPLPKVGEGDYLALMSAGAYGFVQASNYNARPLAAEVLVQGKRSALIRPRQPLEELWASEKIPAWLR
jgi:diaminopimelate decarboxylase